METLQRTANRGSISTGFDIDNSLKFESDNSEELQRNVSSSGSRQTATVSMWIKRTELGVAQYLFTYGNTDNDNGRTFARFQADDTLWIAGGNTLWRGTARVFRDTSAWMHIVIAFDTTQSTANDRFKLYINGVQETSFLTINNPSQNDILGLNFQKQVIGYNSVDGGSYFNGYMAEIVHQDGTASAPTEFGETDSDTGIWIPKDVSGVASGTNGFYLDFEDASNLGNDASGGTDFTLNNITSADQAVDTPTNSFCTWNPLFSFGGNEAVINEGATTADSVSGGWKGAVGTIAATNGKWYWEYRPVAGAFGYRAVGIMGADYSTDDIDDPRDYCPNLFLRDGLSPYIYQHLISGVETAYKAMTSWSSNDSDVFAIALNLDDEEITFYRNGTAITENGTSNTTFSISSVIGQSEPIVPYYRSFDSTEIYFNFGGYTEMTIASGNTDANGYGTFEYAPPSGYYALCSKNLAEFG